MAVINGNIFFQDDIKKCTQPRGLTFSDNLNIVWSLSENTRRVCFTFI